MGSGQKPSSPARAATAKAKEAIPWPTSERTPAPPAPRRRPGGLADVAVDDEPLGLPVEAVRHHVPRPEKRELLVHRPVRVSPAPEEEREPGPAGGGQRPGHDGPRIRSPAGVAADVDGDP